MVTHGTQKSRTEDALQADKPPASPEKQENDSARPEASGTILLVEDSDALREITKAFLQIAGYSVLEARNGADALGLAREFKSAIHLLLTDVVMPGMSGLDLAKSLCAFHPESRLLFMSGYTETGIPKHGMPDKAIHFLTKPFSRQSLTMKVREILDT